MRRASVSIAFVAAVVCVVQAKQSQDFSGTWTYRRGAQLEDVPRRARRSRQVGDTDRY
jgi:hypothetical protein